MFQIESLACGVKPVIFKITDREIKTRHFLTLKRLFAVLKVAKSINTSQLTSPTIAVLGILDVCLNSCQI